MAGGGGGEIPLWCNIDCSHACMLHAQHVLDTDTVIILLFVKRDEYHFLFKVIRS